MKEVLQVKNISKEIKGTKIVDEFSLSMKEGEIVGLVGPNGAGKTTIMRMIVGLIRAASGEIIIDGYSLQDDFINAIKRVGAVIETPELYPYLTGYENLLLLNKLNGKSNKQEIDEIVNLVQLEKNIHKKVKTYSLGMRQRLGVAQALVHAPKLVILDEPMNGLDPVGVKQLRDYLIYIAKEKKVAILVSSHILSEIEIMCDRVVMIAEGKELSGIFHEKTNKFIYCVKINNLENIDKIIGWPINSVNNENSSFEIELEEEEVPACIKKMVQADIDIYSFEKLDEKLEDKFIDMIEGTENDKNFTGE